MFPVTDPDTLELPTLPADPAERKRVEDEAFARLYRWLLDTARVALRARAFRQGSADDVAADVVGGLYEDWDRILTRYDRQQSLRVYLSSVIRNKLIDRWRRERARAERARPLSPAAAAVALADAPAESPARVAPEELEELQARLATLTEEERRLIELRYSEGLTFAEVAERLGKSLTSVYRATLAAVERLQRAGRSE